MDQSLVSTGARRDRTVAFGESATPKLFASALSAARQLPLFAPVSLLLIALATRLLLLSSSIDEVDSANFVNALINGYDIPELRPHPPGYPVYVFAGSVFDLLISDPLRSLTLMSAVFGSLAVLPFFSLSAKIVGRRFAYVAALLLVFNPLYWAFSVVALSDIPATFFAIAIAWAAYAGIRSNGMLLLSAVLLGLAIGVRSPMMALIVLPAFVIGYRVFRSRDVSVRLLYRWVALLLATIVIWLVPMILIGGGGTASYIEAFSKQWTTAVQVYDISSVQSPWLPNAMLRIERFLTGYLFDYPWTGRGERTLVTALLVAPWAFGLGMFVLAFRWRNPAHIFVGLWIASLLYPVVSIHFLPRYGLPHLPALIIAAAIGYRFLFDELPAKRRRAELLAAAGVATLLIMLGIKYQPPAGSFEFLPPATGYFGAVLVMLGALTLVAAKWLEQRESRSESTNARRIPLTGLPRSTALAVFSLLLIPVVLTGFSQVHLNHQQASPTHELVQHVNERFAPGDISVCWDSQTHSYFEVLMPGVVPTGYWSPDDLLAALERGTPVIATDRCSLAPDLASHGSVTESTVFTGSSPTWSKTPSIALYIFDGDSGSGEIAFETRQSDEDVEPLTPDSAQRNSLVRASGEAEE